MMIEIKQLSEAEADRILDVLNGHGFEYEKDYQTLFGPNWVRSGVQITNPLACAVAVQALLPQYLTARNAR